MSKEVQALTNPQSIARLRLYREQRPTQTPLDAQELKERDTWGSTPPDVITIATSSQRKRIIAKLLTEGLSFDKDHEFTNPLDVMNALTQYVPNGDGAQGVKEFSPFRYQGILVDLSPSDGEGHSHDTLQEARNKAVTVYQNRAAVLGEGLNGITVAFDSEVGVKRADGSYDSLGKPYKIESLNMPTDFSTLTTQEKKDWVKKYLDAVHIKPGDTLVNHASVAAVDALTSTIDNPKVAGLTIDTPWIVPDLEELDLADLDFDPQAAAGGLFQQGVINQWMKQGISYQENPELLAEHTHRLLEWIVAPLDHAMEQVKEFVIENRQEAQVADLIQRRRAS